MSLVLAENGNTASRGMRMGGQTIMMKNKTESAPKIETSDYTFGRVRHLEVKKEIPDNLASLAKSDSWATLARGEAFEQLFRELGAQSNFKVECVTTEKVEPDAAGRDHHYIVCRLRYVLE